MRNKANEVKDRYSKGYITDIQLAQYLELGAITQPEYDEIYAIKRAAVGNSQTKL